MNIYKIPPELTGYKLAGPAWGIIENGQVTRLVHLRLFEPAYEVRDDQLREWIARDFQRAAKNAAKKLAAQPDEHPVLGMADSLELVEIPPKKWTFHFEIWAHDWEKANQYSKE